MPADLKDLTRRIVGRLAQEIQAHESVWDEAERDLEHWLPLADYVAQRNHADLEGIISRTKTKPPRSRFRCISPSGWDPDADSPFIEISPDRFTLNPGEISPFLFRGYAERLVAQYPESLELVADTDPPPGAECIYPYGFRFLFVDNRARRATVGRIIAEVIKTRFEGKLLLLPLPLRRP